MVCSVCVCVSVTEKQSDFWFVSIFNLNSSLCDHHMQLNMNSKFIMCLLLWRGVSARVNSPAHWCLWRDFFFFSLFTSCLLKYRLHFDATAMADFMSWNSFVVNVCADCRTLRGKNGSFWFKFSSFFFVPHLIILHFDETNNMTEYDTGKEIAYATENVASLSTIIQSEMNATATINGWCDAIRSTNRTKNINFFYLFWQEIIKLD